MLRGFCLDIVYLEIWNVVYLQGHQSALIPTFGFQLHKNRMKGLSIYLKVCFQKLSLDMKNITLHLFWLTSIGFVRVLFCTCFDLQVSVLFRVLFCTCFDLQVSALFLVLLCTCFELQVSALFQRTQKRGLLSVLRHAYSLCYLVLSCVHRPPRVVDEGNVRPWSGRHP